MNFREPRRRQDRVRVLRTGILTVGDARVDCLVRDLSDGGARLKLSDGGIARGEHGSLTVPGIGEFKGEIMWKQGAEIGMRFEEARPAEPSGALETSSISEVLTLVMKRKRGGG